MIPALGATVLTMRRSPFCLTRLACAWNRHGTPVSGSPLKIALMTPGPIAFEFQQPVERVACIFPETVFVASGGERVGGKVTTQLIAKEVRAETGTP